nr:hypothetical protein [Tanacetum cinerariifolium]
MVGEGGSVNSVGRAGSGNPCPSVNPCPSPTHVRREEHAREGTSFANLVRPISDEDLREYCDKNYHQILPIIAEKLHKEKASQEKLKAVKARLNFEEASRYSESETPSRRRNLKERLGLGYARTRSGSPKPRRGRSKSSREKDPKRRRGSERKSYYSSRRDTKSCYQSSRSKETKIASEKHRHKREYSRRTKAVSESEGSAEGHWKSKPKKQKSSVEDDLSQPWVCKETYHFTPRIRYFDFLKARMPSHIKTYDGSEDPEDHLKIFQAITKTERWAMPTWCHMFNYTLTGNAGCDPVEIHNIKQRDGESTEEFVRRYKLECRDVKGAPECMKIFGFMHGITNPELIKRLHDKIPKSMDELMSITTAFLRGEEKLLKRTKDGTKTRQIHPSYKTPKEILALDKGKFKPPPPMATLVEKRNAIKFCQKVLTFDQGIKAKPWKRPCKDIKKGGNLRERQITGNIDGEEDGTEGPMIIEAEMGGHCVHRIYVDGGFSSEILYEHCFSKFRPEIKNQLIPTNTPLVGFSGEIIWPLGQISLLVKIVAGGIVTLQSSRIILLKYSMVSEPGVSCSVINQVTEEKIQVAIHPEYSKQTIAIGSTLTEEGQKELPGLLRRHLDVFAWKLTDMTRVPRHIAKHRLNVRE